MHENLNEEWLGQASKPELMALARDLGLIIEGKKYQVRNRLFELLKPEEPEEEVEETEDLEPDNPNWPKYDDLGSALEALVGTGSTSALDFSSIEAANTTDDLIDFNVVEVEDEEEELVAVAQVSLPKEIDPELAELRSKKLRQRPIFYDDGVLELYKQRLADTTSEVDKARITEQVAWLQENGKFEFPFVPEPEEVEPEPEVEPIEEKAPDEEIPEVDEPEGHTEESLGEMTKAQLKDLLREMGLPVSGNKTTLIERILDRQSEIEDNIEEADELAKLLKEEVEDDDDIGEDGEEWVEPDDEELEEVD